MFICCSKLHYMGRGPCHIVSASCSSWDSAALVACNYSALAQCPKLDIQQLTDWRMIVSVIGTHGTESK